MFFFVLGAVPMRARVDGVRRAFRTFLSVRSSQSEAVQMSFSSAGVHRAVLASSGGFGSRGRSPGVGGVDDTGV